MKYYETVDVFIVIQDGHVRGVYNTEYQAMNKQSILNQYIDHPDDMATIDEWGMEIEP